LQVVLVAAKEPLDYMPVAAVALVDFVQLLPQQAAVEALRLL
jgi:hypothetical protein